MRKDMNKVIVERPRIGSRMPSRKKGYRKYVQKTGIDELPSREPMLGRWQGRQRWLNEHLGPMRKFLRSRVGRLWNKVHQELCEHVSFDNAVQMHVLTHVFDYVHRHVELRGRDVVKCEDWKWGVVLRPGQMYVCPKTGYLRVVTRRRDSGAAKRLGGGLIQYHKRENAWWELRLRKRPDNPGDAWDPWLERPLSELTDAALSAEYGGKLTAVSARPLSPREARDMLRTRTRRKKRPKTRFQR